MSLTKSNHKPLVPLLYYRKEHPMNKLIELNWKDRLTRYMVYWIGGEYVTRDGYYKKRDNLINLIHRYFKETQYHNRTLKQFARLD